MRPFRTNAAEDVIESSIHWTLGRTSACLRLRGVRVVGRAARVSPQAMMIAAMVTYLVKIIALAVIVSNMNGTTAFSTRTLGFVAIGCILVWSAAQVITAIKVKMLYVEPEQSAARRGG